MKKGRRYKTKEERDNAIKFRGTKLRNMRNEMYEKTVKRSDFRPVRNTTFFKLAFNKVENVYILTDLREGNTIQLSKDVVKDEELAMVDSDNFNRLSRELFGNRN